MRREVCGLVSLFAVLLASACGGESEAPDEQRPALPGAEEVRTELGGVPFDAFVARSYEILLARSPEAVIDLHLEGQIDVGKSFVDDVSDDFVNETQAIERVLLEQVRSYSEQSVTREVYEWYLDDRVRGQAFADLDYRISPTANSVTSSLELFFTDVHPLDTPDDAEKYAARLWSAGRKIEALTATMERLKDAGIIEPRIILDNTIGAIAAIAESDARSTPYYQTLRAKFPADADPAALDRAEAAIESSIIPAYRALTEVLDEELAIAPADAGVWQQPNGDAFYAYALRHHITTEATPDELFQLGMDELTRIHADLDARFMMLGYPAGATLSEQIERVATDGGFVDVDHVLAEYTSIIEDAQMRLPEAFDLLPRANVIVKGVAFGGFYVPASLDGSRPGAFFATVGGQGEARFGMRTLAYHEAVPGHHLQIGVAQDLHLPLFQRVVTFNGFAEGWALYAEWLAGELGWYAGDPYGDIGRLQGEAFRAARLVVDTGMHSKHWTFDQAVQFFMENIGYGRGFAAGQILRYTAWPGQATSYYKGRARILDLRHSAQAMLGASFDQKAFHHAVLSHGSVPLGVLDRIVAEEVH